MDKERFYEIKNYYQHAEHQLGNASAGHCCEPDVSTALDIIEELIKENEEMAKMLADPPELVIENAKLKAKIMELKTYRSCTKTSVNEQ